MVRHVSVLAWHTHTAVTHAHPLSHPAQTQAHKHPHHPLSKQRWGTASIVGTKMLAATVHAVDVLNKTTLLVQVTRFAVECVCEFVCTCV